MAAPAEKIAEQESAGAHEDSSRNEHGEHSASLPVADNRPQTQSLTGMQSLAQSGPRATQFQTIQAKVLSPVTPLHGEPLQRAEAEPAQERAPAQRVESAPTPASAPIQRAGKEGVAQREGEDNGGIDDAMLAHLNRPVTGDGSDTGSAPSAAPSTGGQKAAPKPSGGGGDNGGIDDAMLAHLNRPVTGDGSKPSDVVSDKLQGPKGMDAVKGAGLGKAVKGARDTVDKSTELAALSQEKGLVGASQQLLESSKEAPKATGMSWLDTVASWGHGIFQTVSQYGVLQALSIVKNAYDLYTANNARNAFIEAQKGVADSGKKDMIDAAKHGVEKVTRKTYGAVLGVVKSIIDLAAFLIGLLGGPIGAAWAVVTHLATGALSALATAGKKIKGAWKILTGTRGKHRAKSAKTVLKEALDGDPVALKLLLSLGVVGGKGQRLKRYVKQDDGALKSIPAIENTEQLSAFLAGCARGEYGYSLTDLEKDMADKWKSS